MAAEMWYYTTEGKQMDPVTIRELRRLADDGLLKPTDMVWKDGMARWIRASSVKELFPEPGSELDQFFTSSGSSKDAKKTSPLQQSTAAAIPAAAPAESETSTKKGRPPVEEDDDARQQRRKRRPASGDDDRSSPGRNDPKSGTSGVILIAVLVGGGLVFIAVVVGILILVFARGSNPGGTVVENPLPIQIVNKSATYVEDVPPLAQFRRTVKLRAGASYEVTVRSEPRQPDVNLFILTNMGAIEVSDSISFGPDAKIDNWTPREDGDFKIEVKNMDPVSTVKSTVVIRELTPGKGKKPVDEPLPKDVLTGKSSFVVKSPNPGEEQVFKFRVQTGHNVNFNIALLPKKGKEAATDFNLIVLRDSDGAQLGADLLPAAAAVVNFRATATEIVRVRVVNAGKSVPTRCTLFYDVSP